MTGDLPHMLVSVSDAEHVSAADRGNDRRNNISNICQSNLPDTVDAKIVSSDACMDWTVFRHSVAPYLGKFDREGRRTLLKLSLSDWETGATPLENAMKLGRHAAALSEQLPIDMVCWPYAQLISGIEQLKAALLRFESGRDVPVLEYVRMRLGREGTLTSAGLYFFCGQEIRLQSIGDMSAAGLVRRACRIAADAMVHGPYDGARVFAGLAAGEQVEIKPEPKGLWRRQPQWLTVKCDVRSATLSGMDI